VRGRPTRFFPLDDGMMILVILNCLIFKIERTDRVFAPPGRP
jgi:hypothetical protein